MAPACMHGLNAFMLQWRDVLHPVNAQLNSVFLSGPRPLAYPNSTLAPCRIQSTGTHEENAGRLALRRNGEKQNAARIGRRQERDVLLEVVQSSRQLP